jgi:hypothetical protein
MRIPDEMRVLVSPAAMMRSLGELRSRAIALPMALDDTVFRPTADVADRETKMSVLAVLRPGPGLRETVDGLERLRAVLGESGQVRTIGHGSVDALLAAGAPEGPWQAEHHAQARGGSLARLLGTSDIFVDPQPRDLTGRTMLSAMACGAVPVVAASPAAIELSSGGRDAVLVAPGSGEAWTDVVERLAVDWPRLRELRARSIDVGRRHGLASAGASRFAAFRTLTESGSAWPAGPLKAEDPQFGVG